jgi:hypothetical protein
MLLSSILQILSQYQPQSKTVEKMSQPSTREVFSIPAQDASSGLQQLEQEIASAAGLLRPISAEPGQAPVSLPGPNIEELKQLISKFKTQNKSRVLDVFE